MAWLEPILDELSAAETWPYQPGCTGACEPAALAALTLEAHGRHDAADSARRWLAERQATDGSVGISELEASPRWPTGLAVLAWQSAAIGSGKSPYRDHIDRAIAWMLTIEGKPAPRNPDMGHDTTLVGWPWVEGTHSWIEPTAWCLLALKAVGKTNNLRAREAVQLLFDRQLPEGGCNYGNTFVLGQELRAQLEPTGLTLLALLDESDPSGRLRKSLDYARQQVGPETTASSLAYGLLGLAAHGQFPNEAEAWLAAAATRTRARPGPMPRLALLALAARGAEGPVIAMCRHGGAP